MPAYVRRSPPPPPHTPAGREPAGQLDGRVPHLVNLRERRPGRGRRGEGVVPRRCQVGGMPGAESLSGSTPCVWCRWAGCATLARCTSCLAAQRRMDLAFTRFAAPCLTPCTWSGTSIAPDVFTRWPCIPPHTHMSQNINLFMETSEEEFAKYLQTFVADVWGLLMKVSLKPGQVRGSRGCAPEGAPPSLKRSSNCEGQSLHGHIRQFGTRARDYMSVSAPCAHTHCCCCSRTTS